MYVCNIHYTHILYVTSAVRGRTRKGNKMRKKKKIEIDEIESVTDWFRYVITSIIYYYIHIVCLS